ncbi:hypothetical protein GUJ93_ZPchr0012g19368 [Zizania palustris]|uniref:Uncharacterized protein n=1 Tax=Zizania palustris TaxID=103762 RepID=A0A8J5WVA9_ZIZPA|nr:hypothetical protein GUJ93_ZPchr0012g19368 [Zizania palustris]
MERGRQVAAMEDFVHDCPEQVLKYFDNHSIKNVTMDRVEIDWEGDIDEGWVKEINCFEWESFAFHPNPLVVLVFEHYNRMIRFVYCGDYAIFSRREANHTLGKMSKDEADVSGDLSGITGKKLGVLADWETKFQAMYPIIVSLTDA